MKHELNKYNLLAFLKALKPNIVGLVSKLGLPFRYEGVELGKHVDLRKGYENGSWDFRFRAPLPYFRRGKEDVTKIKGPILFIVNVSNAILMDESNAKKAGVDALDERGNIDANALSEKATVALRALRWIYEALNKAYDTVSQYDVDKFINYATKWNENPTEEVCMGISPGTGCWHSTRPKR